MKAIIGQENVGFTVIDAVYTTPKEGYCIAEKEGKLVTWYFNIFDDKLSFAVGHYFIIDPDSPLRSRARAFSDFYLRISDQLLVIAKHGIDFC